MGSPDQAALPPAQASCQLSSPCNVAVNAQLQQHWLQQQMCAGCNGKHFCGSAWRPCLEAGERTACFVMLTGVTCCEARCGQSPSWARSGCGPWCGAAAGTGCRLHNTGTEIVQHPTCTAPNSRHTILPSTAGCAATQGCLLCKHHMSPATEGCQVWCGTRTVLGVVQPRLALLQGGLLLGACCAAIGAEQLRCLRADVVLLLCMHSQ
jgi:hypothetical protein